MKSCAKIEPPRGGNAQFSKYYVHVCNSQEVSLQAEAVTSLECACGFMQVS